MTLKRNKNDRAKGKEVTLKKSKSNRRERGNVLQRGSPKEEKRNRRERGNVWQRGNPKEEKKSKRNRIVGSSSSSFRRSFCFSALFARARSFFWTLSRSCASHLSFLRIGLHSLCLKIARSWIHQISSNWSCSSCLEAAISWAHNHAVVNFLGKKVWSLSMVEIFSSSSGHKDSRNGRLEQELVGLESSLLFLWSVVVIWRGFWGCASFSRVFSWLGFFHIFSSCSGALKKKEIGKKDNWHVGVKLFSGRNFATS